jgi:hypothetical protein
MFTSAIMWNMWKMRNEIFFGKLYRWCGREWAICSGNGCLLCSKIKINAGGVDQRLGRQSNRDFPIKMAMKRRKTMGIAGPGTPEAHLEHRAVA